MQAVLLGKEVDSAVETGKEPGKVIEMKTGVSDGSIGMVPRGVFGAEAGVVAGAAKDGVSGDLEGGRSSGFGSGSGIKDGLSGGFVGERLLYMYLGGRMDCLVVW